MTALQLISGPVCARFLHTVFLSLITVLDAVASSALLLWKRWLWVCLQTEVGGSQCPRQGHLALKPHARPGH